MSWVRIPAGSPTCVRRGPSTFSPVGYETLAERGDFGFYMFNSVVVTGGTLLAVLVFGSMAAFALARFRFSRLLGLYLALGIMIPIRIGTVSILSLMSTWALPTHSWD